VDWKRAGAAVVGSVLRERFTILAVDLFPFAVSISFAFAFPLASCNVVLVEGALTLLIGIAITVAVGAAPTMQGLAIHLAWLLEASLSVLVSQHNGHK
jgi:hypothetical protein